MTILQKRNHYYGQTHNSAVNWLQNTQLRTIARARRDSFSDCIVCKRAISCDGGGVHRIITTIGVYNFIVGISTFSVRLFFQSVHQFCRYKF